MFHKTTSQRTNYLFLTRSALVLLLIDLGTLLQQHCPAASTKKH